MRKGTTRGPTLRSYSSSLSHVSNPRPVGQRLPTKSFLVSRSKTDDWDTGHCDDTDWLRQTDRRGEDTQRERQLTNMRTINYNDAFHDDQISVIRDPWSSVNITRLLNGRRLIMCSEELDCNCRYYSAENQHLKPSEPQTSTCPR